MGKQYLKENEDQVVETPVRIDSSDPGATDRRSFIKAALATAPVILTVTSKPVWAAQSCTASGQMSGNLSGQQVTCDGFSPGYWSNHNWPAGVQKSELYSDHFDYPTHDNAGNDFDQYTLWQVLDQLPGDNNGGSNAEARHAVAALLNSYYFTGPEFPSTSYVISLVNSQPYDLEDKLICINEGIC